MIQYSMEVKEEARRLDPECWVSYSGKPKSFKQYIDGRRSASLRQAQENIGEVESEFDNARFAAGVHHAVTLLAGALGVEDWHVHDGSEDHDTDVRDTMLHILQQKGLSPREGEPFGYVLAKSGIDNGHYFIDPKSYALVEERFRYIYRAVYVTPPPINQFVKLVDIVKRALQNHSSPTVGQGSVHGSDEGFIVYDASVVFVVSDIVSAIAGGVGWLTIDSAPKDGTLIDLWGADQRLTDSLWLGPPETVPGWYRKGSIGTYLVEAEALPAHPRITHWRPRPAAP